MVTPGTLGYGVGCVCVTEGTSFDPDFLIVGVLQKPLFGSLGIPRVVYVAVDTDEYVTHRFHARWPSSDSCFPVYENKPADIEQSTSFAYFWRARVRHRCCSRCLSLSLSVPFGDGAFERGRANASHVSLIKVTSDRPTNYRLWKSLKVFFFKSIE